jgi:hypothetical protein
LDTPRHLILTADIRGNSRNQKNLIVKIKRRQGEKDVSVVAGSQIPRGGEEERDGGPVLVMYPCIHFTWDIQWRQRTSKCAVRMLYKAITCK